MLPAPLAMVRGEDDQGLFGDAQVANRFDQLAELCVEKRNLGVIPVVFILLTLLPLLFVGALRGCGKSEP